MPSFHRNANDPSKLEQCASDPCKLHPYNQDIHADNIEQAYEKMYKHEGFRRVSPDVTSRDVVGKTYNANDELVPSGYMRIPSTWSADMVNEVHHIFNSAESYNTEYDCYMYTDDCLPPEIIHDMEESGYTLGDRDNFYSGDHVIISTPLDSTHVSKAYIYNMFILKPPSGAGYVETVKSCLGEKNFNHVVDFINSSDYDEGSDYDSDDIAFMAHMARNEHERRENNKDYALADKVLFSIQAYESAMRENKVPPLDYSQLSPKPYMDKYNPSAYTQTFVSDNGGEYTVMRGCEFVKR